jgi:hypothetical protein
MLMPFMSRTGDLLQRENLMTTEGQRGQTQEIAQNIGDALENLARVCASTAHLYRSLDLGTQPGQVRINP